MPLYAIYSYLAFSPIFIWIEDVVVNLWYKGIKQSRSVIYCAGSDWFWSNIINYSMYMMLDNIGIVFELMRMLWLCCIFVWMEMKKNGFIFKIETAV